ncbi:hypothetical protein Ddye_012040 [Dipteronia dyeriana]|uniref:VQ domain-containing protein n=1 Tax=Dipteronia dyeriana TaxID=168575 RepID=A0AAD9X3P6_9ROSI|nr:hypothetical protein Ddye_012040 [Dipteronia dyeriana]
MTSSENLADSWAFRSAFPADSWLSDAYARDTETLTKALQKSLSGATANDNFISSNAVVSESDFISTPTVSNVSGSSDHETTMPTKRQRNAVPVSHSGKVSKRKSRASKRTQTTFITADPANFRQMVQQVTGVRFGNSQMPVTQILKPEPQRPGTRLPGLGGCLPTLDTSAFLLDHHQQHVVMGPVSGPGSGSGSSLGSGPFPFQGSLVADGGLDFETFPNFPTLESWKVM